MLVLSRKRGELIRIGSDVEVTVLGIHGDRVVVGLTAPAKVPIHRQEVFERISQDNHFGARRSGRAVTKHRMRRPAYDVSNG